MLLWQLTEIKQVEVLTIIKTRIKKKINIYILYRNSLKIY